MAASSYDAALARVLAHEGGYTNHPSDPGGPTNFGITLAVYRQYAKPNARADDIRAMSADEAKAIYRAKYWDIQRCDELSPGVDYAMFDYGVNSGPGRSGKVLRRVLKLPDASSVVTDEVIHAANAADAKQIVAAICDERLRFLKSLKTWPVFGVGWERRVADVKRISVAMAASQASSRGIASKPAGAGAAIVVGTAVVVQQAHPGVDPKLIAVVVIAAAVACAAGWWLWHRHKTAQEI